MIPCGSASKMKVQLLSEAPLIAECREAFPAESVSHLASTEQRRLYFLVTSHFFRSSPLTCGFGGELFVLQRLSGPSRRNRNNTFQSWYSSFKPTPAFIYTRHCRRAETAPVFICVPEERSRLTAHFLSSVDSAVVRTEHNGFSLQSFHPCSAGDYMLSLTLQTNENTSLDPAPTWQAYTVLCTRCLSCMHAVHVQHPLPH